jgi:hypothetical protein
MSKKPDTASALAGILKAKRGGDDADEPVTPAAVAPIAEKQPPPSPAPLPTPTPSLAEPVSTGKKGRVGKSSDKANYSQFSVYLRKDTRKKVGRALDDMDSDKDFSELVQSLLEQWLKSNT